MNKLFLSEIEPREGLLGAVMARIATARRRAARLRLLGQTLGFLALLSALIPSLSYAVHEFYESGFYTYLSLFFSDTQTALLYRHELVLSLAESFPSLALLPVMVFGAALVWVVSGTAANMKAARSSFA